MRIVAGAYKGRNLLSPPKGAVTRPITGMAKESLFQILAPRMPDAVVADLYSGTGTLGLEALSRGAALACFAERAAGVVARLRRNIEQLGVEERCIVWRGNVETQLARWLSELSRPVDVAFVDPPYAAARRWDWARAERRLFDPLAAALSPEGTVALRLPADVVIPERVGALAVGRVKQYGDMTVALLRAAEEGG